MDAGPGTDLGGLAWYVGIWVVMMAAMMLPSAVPAILAFSHFSSKRAGRRSPTAFFVGGYLVTWTLYGLLAYIVYRVLRDAAPNLLAWDRAGRYVAAAALLFAGVYELTPLKHACLRRCRGALAVIGRWRDGASGAAEMGVRHGLDCVGCCWGLMLALFALGVMSLTWMATVALAIAAEKLLPHPQRVVAAIAVLAVALGAWTALG
jgi:predicted metal-binding membrane protein